MVGSSRRAPGRPRIAVFLAIALVTLGMEPSAGSPNPAGTGGGATTAGVAPTADRAAPPPGSAPTDCTGSRRSDRPVADFPDPPPAPPYKVTAYTIRTLARSALPYVGTGRPTKVPPGLHDADGLPMKRVGTQLYYGPAGLAQYGIIYEDAYRRTGDPDYLAIARKVMNKLMALGVESNGGVFIQYRFNYPLHQISTEVMKAPWYSAMAQGISLSLAVRLCQDTGEEVFKTDADLLFASMNQLGRGSSPWVTYVAAGYVWLEEYPEPTTPSDHTANGFNFALFGLYDYYQETKDPAALQLLQGSLTTMRHYISAYRRPGTYSKYCLRHGRPQPKYHKIVTWQLVYLYKISGDPYFLSMSKLFTSDYH